MPTDHGAHFGDLKDRHNTNVATIASDVREFHQHGQEFRIYHGSTNSTRKANFHRDQIIDTSGLCNVLEVDVEQRTILVEPNVPMDHLVAATLKHGLLPPVVMEFPGITVGGGFAGTSGESSSFKYGFFEQTVVWIEVVLANGDVVSASASEREDLLRGAGSSFGTLGVTTLLKISLIDAKPYVQLTYHPVVSVAEAVKKIRAEVDDSSNDFIDGILFTKETGAIITGRLVDRMPPLGVKLQRFSRASDPWFYLHAQKVTKNCPVPSMEFVPVTDYLFRYDRGAFWTGKYAFRYFMVPFTLLTRFLLDFFLHARVMYHALHKSGHTDRYFIQDIAMPYEKAEAFIVYTDRCFGLYPLWLCPIKRSLESALQPRALSKIKHQNVINIGVWGPGPTDSRKFFEANRKFEKQVQTLSGLKWLYANAYYTEEEFWEIYDRQSYDTLRDKYQAASLPTVYDKVKVDCDIRTASSIGNRSQLIPNFLWGIWPVSGLYGVWKTIFGREYLLAR